MKSLPKVLGTASVTFRVYGELAVRGPSPSSRAVLEKPGLARLMSVQGELKLIDHDSSEPSMPETVPNRVSSHVPSMSSPMNTERASSGLKAFSIADALGSASLWVQLNQGEETMVPLTLQPSSQAS